MAKKTVSTEDSDLFRQSIGKVKTIEKNSLHLTPETKPKPFPQKKVEKDITQFKQEGELEVDKLFQEDRISFIAPGLQKNVLKKLRKGYFGFDASIDLHGLTSQKAKQQLAHFLHDSIENGYRCVHIIHGKGYRSAHQHPVLKNDINLWLRQYPYVLAFCSTPPKEGGTGAVFVLLKLSEKYTDEEDSK